VRTLVPAALLAAVFLSAVDGAGPWGGDAPPPAAARVERGRILYPPSRQVWLATPDGPRRVSSLLDVPGRMSFGQYAWRDEGVPAGRTWIRVDLDRQTMSVFRGADEIGSAVVIYGTDGKPTPRGTFRILEKDADHVSSLYDARMPYMLRLTGDGVAIHASDVRRGSATHGCIGVPPGFARLLFAATRRGDPVVVTAADRV
jgi:hypothetical protein